MARALLASPRLVIFDESFNGIDADTRDRILKNLRCLDYPRTFLIVTHSEGLLRQCDQTISMGLEKHDSSDRAA